MRTCALYTSLLLALAAAPAQSGDAPLAVGVPYDARSAGADSTGNTGQMTPAMRSERRRSLDPLACASLCRVFEFLGSLERPKPAEPVPTS